MRELPEHPVHLSAPYVRGQAAHPQRFSGDSSWRETQESLKINAVRKMPGPVTSPLRDRLLKREDGADRPRTALIHA